VSATFAPCYKRPATDAVNKDNIKLRLCWEVLLLLLL
jgi:hypothetical protein